MISFCVDQTKKYNRAGRTLLSVLAQLGMHDVIRTAVLAAIAALVSFAVTWALQRLQWKR